MKTLSATVFAAACVAAASAAQALPRANGFNLELFASGNMSMPGSMRGQVTPFELGGDNGSVTYDDLKFDDAYKTGVGTGLELGYAFNDHVSTYARAAYNQFDGDSLRMGEVTTTGTPRALTARFGDTSTREFDLGARYTFTSLGKVSPFVGAALGATHLTAARASFDNFDGFGRSYVELAKPATALSQRAELGVQYSPVRNFDLRLTAAADHVDVDRKSEDLSLAAIGLGGDRGELRGHWDYPAELGAVWHF